MIVSILALLRVRSDDPTLAIAQQAALSKQIPLMYFILLVNTWGVAATHLHAAPPLLTITFPLLMTLVCGVRMFYWWNRNDRLKPDAAKAIAELRRTNRISWVLAALFALWGISLAPYGDSFMQSHVAFYMGITVIGCIFCLTHLLSAAMAVTLVVNITFIAYFGLTGNEIFIAMAIDVGLVSVAMLLVLWVQYRDFTHLITSRRELELKKNVLEEREVQLIIEQKQTQALSDENKRLANIDSLTNLSNRRFFFSKLNEAEIRLQKGGADFHIGLIDLDGFKPVNDLYGHKVGDDLLIELAARLAQVCRGRALVARLGGDEFAILMETSDSAVATELADDIGHACRQPFTISDTVVEIGASIGISSSKLCVEASRGLYEQADYALYHAKRNARGCAVAFSHEHYVSLSRLTVIERAFRDASIDRDISLDFQPIYDLHRDEVVAFEALARWRHPDLGFISPAEFIPAAERLGYINHLSRVLLGKALKETTTWPDHIGLSFNLSARDIASNDQALRIMSIIAESGVRPDRIDLEITETALLSDLERAQAIAQGFISAGMGVSLDDFGTGFSSLTHLHSMPLTNIKIDRSFVTAIDKNPASAKIVKSLVRMASDMNLKCIVEGVETSMELDVIRELGGCFVQGYHLSKPLSASDARQLASGNQAHASSAR